MSDQNDNGTPQRRRMSLVDMFSSRPNISSSPPSAGVPPTPDTSQHRRGLSISALGLTTAPSGQTSPFNAFAKQRRASVSGSSAASSSPEFRNSFGDEPAVIEEDETPRSSYGSPPSPSFARRVSFGAQALRDVRQSSGAAAAAPGGGEGFNWSEALRDRTKRSPSFSSGNPFASRVKSTSGAAQMEPPKELPKPTSPPLKMKKPDHLGERMLRGDFMMD